jgi:tetratricopeptide (TPR) repeat protein
VVDKPAPPPEDSQAPITTVANEPRTPTVASTEAIAPAAAGRVGSRGAMPAAEVAIAQKDPSRRVAHYVLLEELGRGGMGVVYRAWDTRLGRYVALKMVIDPLGNQAGQIERLQVEAMAAARLRHPAIVSIYDVGEHEGKPFVAMELIDGTSFEAELLAGKSDPLVCAKLIRDIALALEHAHRSGVVHRDVKPENVIIDRAGKPHLMDFGLAREQQSLERLTLPGSVLGTPAYMAPEQARGDTQAQGPHTDIYALGASLYRSLAGRPVFDAPSLQGFLLKIQRDEPIPIRTLVPGVPRDLETIALRCLQKEPARRYPTAQAVADELGRFLRHEPIVARPIGSLERATLWVRRNPLLGTAVLCVFAALLTTVLLAVFIVRQRLEDDRRLAALAAEQKKAEEEARAGQETRERNRREAIERLHLAQAKRAARDLDGALADLNKAIALDPLDVAALAERYSLEVEKKDQDGALGDLDRLIELDPNDLARVRARAELHRTRNEREKALADYDRAIEIDPTDAASFRLRGEAHRLWGQVEPALADFGKAIELNPRYTAAYSSRALLESNRNEDSVIADYTKCIELDPKAASWLVQRGLAHYRKKQYDDAIEDASAAIRIDARSGDAWARRGIFYNAKGDTDLALADIDRAVELEPQRGIWRKYRADVRTKRGDIAGAIEDISAAIEREPANADHWQQRSALHLREKDGLELAFQDADKAIALKADLAVAWRDRANARAAKDPAAAAADLEKYLALAPKASDAAAVKRQIADLRKKAAK